jgi:hypothetical protein
LFFLRSHLEISRQFINDCSSLFASFLGSPSFCRGIHEHYYQHLLDQQVKNIEYEECRCVQESISQAVAIFAVDLSFQLQMNKECKLLSTLELVLDKSKTFYKGFKESLLTISPGSPETRLEAIEQFWKLKGFAMLTEYLGAITTTPSISNDFHEPTAIETVVISAPSLTLLRQVIHALNDSMNFVPVDPCDAAPSGMLQRI